MQSRLTVRADADALRRVSDFVGEFTQRHRIDAADHARVAIILEELLTNLLKYGYTDRPEPGAAEVALELEVDILSIEFADDGRPFDPLAEPPPAFDESVESRPIGKIGLEIVRALTDEASYRREDDRNILRMVRRVALA
ncbi:MAG: ATP-binding protein [Candidatus Binataceae bacterium]